MKTPSWPFALATAIAFGMPVATYAQGGGIPYPAASSGEIMPDQEIELKDGTKIVHDANGIMFHVDAKGHRLTMKGTMEAKDGSVYLMKDNYVWKLIAKGERPHRP